MTRLLLLATGGTIAGCADDSATLNDYTAGVLGGDALMAAVPQLPLTVLNSVVSVCELSQSLYGGVGRAAPPAHVAASVGLMNVAGCWFGVMPWWATACACSAASDRNRGPSTRSFQYEASSSFIWGGPRNMTSNV